MARNVQVKKGNISVNETFSKGSGDPYDIKMNGTLCEGVKRYIIPGSLDKQFFDSCLAQQPRINEIERIDFTLTLEGKELHFSYKAYARGSDVSYEISFQVMDRSIGLAILRRLLRTQIEKSPRAFDRAAVCAK